MCSSIFIRVKYDIIPFNKIFYYRYYTYMYLRKVKNTVQNFAESNSEILIKLHWHNHFRSSYIFRIAMSISQIRK